MRAAFDIDGSIDAAPKQFASLMQALKAAGHWVTVLTGSPVDPIPDTIWQEKANYLNELGCGECWDDLVVVSAPFDVSKAAWLADNDVDTLIDNDKGNCKAAVAAGVPLVLCPWASRE